MAKKLKIEGIDAVGILNSIRPVSEPLKEILKVENTTETSESNNRRIRTGYRRSAMSGIYQRESNL